MSQREDEARQYISTAQSVPENSYSKYHLHRLRVTLDEDLIRCDLQKEIFDQWKIPETLAAAEEWAADADHGPRYISPLAHRIGLDVHLMSRVPN
jgi:hypothetical protein